MSNIFKSTVVTAGLAIFSMFFGAANLMYPVITGLNSGDKFIWGLIGFLATAVILPFVGLVAVILFNGSYNTFFDRLGKVPSFLIIAFCMAILGPLIAMSRCITLSHIMLLPFMPNVSLPIFSLISCILIFAATYKESKVIDLLGNLISPLLLVSLGIILVKGIATAEKVFQPTTRSTWDIFYQQALLGYAHLDLLGGIFFASIVLTLLKKNSSNNSSNIKALAVTSIKAGLVGCTLLALVYTGMALLGAFYGPQFDLSNGGQLFSDISFHILGSRGAFVLAIAVAMACFSTIIALATILAEYIVVTITQEKVKHVPALIGLLTVTGVLSCYGLEAIMAFSTPLINTLYPVIIVITFLNLGYKLFNFTPIKIPVLIALIASVYINYFI